MGTDAGNNSNLVETMRSMYLIAVLYKDGRQTTDIIPAETALEMAAGVAALAGHNWPVHLGLRGGRGAATAVGVLLAALPALAIPLGLMALVVLYLTRSGIKSLGFFLVIVPVAAGLILWVGTNSYSYAITAYALAIPLLVGLSHYISVKLDLYRQHVAPELAGQPGGLQE
mgnify:CR=1 FL=1